jgi:hypothetical protein
LVGRVRPTCRPGRDAAMLATRPELVRLEHIEAGSRVNSGWPSCRRPASGQEPQRGLRRPNRRHHGNGRGSPIAAWTGCLLDSLSRQVPRITPARPALTQSHQLPADTPDARRNPGMPCRQPACPVPVHDNKRALSAPPGGQRGYPCVSSAPHRGNLADRRYGSGEDQRTRHFGRDFSAVSST